MQGLFNGIDIGFFTVPNQALIGRWIFIDKTELAIGRSSGPEVFRRKGVLRKITKFSASRRVRQNVC